MAVNNNRGKPSGKTRSSLSSERERMIGEKLNFASTEAYNLLRTNVVFSFPQSDGKVCRVIGVTSSMRGEGKSLTSINLGYSLAKDSKKVLIIECDLRLPTIAKRLSLDPAPGLSNVLVGLCPVSEALQMYEGNKNLHVITSGNVPPNPSELIGSERMSHLITALKANYDYIILDLPPVNVVADGLVASKLSDGMIIVVRENYTDSRSLDETVHQLEFTNAKILGIVFNASEGSQSGYGKYKYGKKHYYAENGNENRK